MVAEGTLITHGTHQYSVGSLIKSGGFGCVYRAKRLQPAPQIDLAIKVPGDHVLKDPVWSKKFAREARILANISHRNVVKIIAFWTFADGEMALAQELVEGAQPLHEYVKANPADASSVLAQSLYALRAFHGAGSEPAAIHRDLSPANILVDKDGVVKVIDFGLAKEDPRLTEILTQAGEGFGTYGCIAPEQMDAAATVDHRADLFALGRSFTAAVQGRMPMHAQPDKLPEPWRTVCVKLTEHEVGDRYQDATEALSAVFKLFAASGMLLADFRSHAAEVATFPEPIDGWPQMCSLFFKGFTDVFQPVVEYAAKTIESWVFTWPGFDANGFFDQIEAGSAIAAFDAHSASFADCDPLGEVYKRLYPALNTDRKLRCFQQLCKIAIGWHRYAVMGNVREVFKNETDPAIEKQLLQIIDTEDPNKTIHGYDIIPGR